jgi:tRNA dimethylallyltransferase
LANGPFTCTSVKVTPSSKAVISLVIDCGMPKRRTVTVNRAPNVNRSGASVTFGCSSGGQTWTTFAGRARKSNSRAGGQASAVTCSNTGIATPSVPTSPATFRDSLILTGPTGSGKTALGVELTERLGAEIVAMDSMTLYRGLDVGTAKPTAEERRRVPHHLIDVLDPWESASVAWWLERAAEVVAEIQGRGRRVLFVGGTPLYLKALLCGLFDGPPADAALRARLTTEAERDGAAALHARLAAVDPVTARRLHPNDVRRVVRALEVFELTGRPISEWQLEWNPASRGRQPPDAFGVSDPSQHQGADAPRSPVLCLTVPRPELYARINRRVEAMIAAGWVEEVRRLRQLPHALSREASQALGYREVGDYLDGKVSLPATVELIQTRSRQFAKRQLTWFRHLPGCRTVPPDLTTALSAATML